MPGFREGRVVDFFFEHVPVGEVEHLVERLTVGPFRFADTEAYRKVVETARLIPFVQGSLDPIYHSRGAVCVGVRQRDQETRRLRNGWQRPYLGSSP